MLDKMLEYIRKTNQEMTKEKLLEELKKSNQYSVVALKIISG